MQFFAYSSWIFTRQRACLSERVDQRLPATHVAGCTRLQHPRLINSFVGSSLSTITFCTGHVCFSTILRLPFNFTSNCLRETEISQTKKVLVLQRKCKIKIRLLIRNFDGMLQEVNVWNCKIFHFSRNVRIEIQMYNWLVKPFLILVQFKRDWQTSSKDGENKYTYPEAIDIHKCVRENVHCHSCNIRKWKKIKNKNEIKVKTKFKME